MADEHPRSDALLDLALHAARLKRVPRSGWQRRAAPLGGRSEDVAAHSFGVAFIAMMLVDLDPRRLDPERVLRLALLHDLAETLVGDLPRPVRRFIPGEIKAAAERAALDEILANTPPAAHYVELWDEYTAMETPEARLVKDADRLDMMIQAFLYEEAGQRNLGEFWDRHDPDAYSTPIARAIYLHLVTRREALR